jgi:hypothetical protein
MNWKLTRLTAALVMGTSGIMAGVALTIVPAGASTNLIGWTATSDANVFDLVVDNSAGLGGYHPVSEVDVPEDTSVFETGPFGQGLATILWPGAAAGNAGSLAGEAGLPSQLTPITNQLNDPIRAESFYPAGPTSATFPSGVPATGGLEMTSQTTVNGSSAKAGLADVTVPGLFTLQGAQGSTTATATTAASSTAAGSFQSLSLLGGLIQIGATSGTASAQSDGVSPNGTSTSHIGAITIAGYTVSVGSDGLVLGPVAGDLSGLLAIPLNVVNQIISALNLKITALPQTQISQAPAEQITSAGVSISFAVPQNLSLSVNCTSLPSALAELGAACHLSDELAGLNFTLNIGRVTAQAIAAQPFAVAPLQTDLGLPGTVTSPSFNSGSLLNLGLVPTVPTTSSTTPAPAATAPAKTSPHPLLDILPVASSSPVTTGLLILLLALAAAFGLAFRRITVGMGGAASDACPNEEET